MIDIENEIFDAVASALRAEFPGIVVQSKLNLAPTEFPCVSFEEAANAVLRKTQDSGSMERHAEVLYEANVFSSRTSGAKAECKAIFQVIDTVMSAYGFTRLSKHPVDEEAPVKYRLNGRYRAVVSEQKEIYTR